MKTTLPTLSEIVNDRSKIMDHPNDTLTHYYKILKYNEFLNQPIKLEMFIPCKDGVHLEEPNVMAKEFDSDTDKMSDDSGAIKYVTACDEYQQAKDRVIFKGFELNEDIVLHTVRNGYTQIKFTHSNSELFVSEKKKQISDLCNKVELTDNEFKRLNL